MSDLETLRALVDAACASLERSRRRIDDLNVYPVPDGDTGTNMLLTARGVADALAQSEAHDRPALAQEVTRAALLGARGNSGVILSQIVRGAAEALAGADAIDGPAVARAFRAASDTADAAMREPVEGTILTAARALADEAEAARQDETIPELFQAVVRRGEEAVARTKEQLDVLRQAGVVDAGAAGLLELVRGLAAEVAGEELPPAPSREQLAPEAVHQEQSRFRYCTMFVVEAEDLDADALERELERLGDSLLVVGDSSALKAHVHTDDPEAALALGAAVGTVERVEVADMHAQTEEREERLSPSVEPAARSAVVAVCAGDGNRRLFERLGAARIVGGGQTMNPPTAELLAAVEATNGDEVLVLPNNANVILAAEQAAQLAERPVEVVPTRSLQAGLAALIAFNAERSATENAAEMRRAAEALVAGEVTTASRDTTVDGIAVRAGEFLGLVNERAVAAGREFAEIARAVAEALLAEPRDVLTLVTGAGAPSLDGLVDELAERHPDLEIEVHDGGQPHYPLLLSAE
jgi:DAK2 domain fusion protein YloV